VTDLPGRPRSPWPGRLTAVGLLLGCALAGFVFHRLTRPARAQLYALPSAATHAPAVPAAPAAEGARAIPAQLPDIALPGQDGVMHHLSEWHSHALLINFWATWCEPCRREIPLLKSLRAAHAAQGLEVIGIAIDARDEVRAYTRAHGMDYPVLLGDKGGFEAARAFGMDTVLPFSVFADEAGEIVTLKIGELHRDEADFILERIQQVDSKQLSLPAARTQIADAIRRFNLARNAAGS
jgi:thiol-disulfide isomerase/thioredoxin